MKCLKCLEPIKDGRKVKLNKYLEHISKWDLCDSCLYKHDNQKKEVANLYYNKHKKRYRKLHIGYKSELVDSYVANAIADRTSLKAKDIPKNVIQAKRQFMKINRITKEVK